MAKVLILVGLFASVVNAGVVKRAFWDVLPGKISNVGSTVLPDESMRCGCSSVHLYNREKNGGPPNKSIKCGIFGGAGSGLAKLGNTVFSNSGMEQGCVNAGYYDPNLDSEGRPKVVPQQPNVVLDIPPPAETYNIVVVPGTTTTTTTTTTTPAPSAPITTTTTPAPSAPITTTTTPPPSAPITTTTTPAPATPTPKPKRYRCLVNGVVSPCDERHRKKAEEGKQLESS